MKTPTWGTVIGIIMIFFGGCGALNDMKTISMPEELARQKELMKSTVAEKEVEKDSVRYGNIDSLTSTSTKDDEEISFFGKKQSVEEMLELSAFTKTWIVRFGYIGVFASLLYLLGGIFLLIKKTFSIKLVYAALIISILCSGAQTAVLTSSSSSGIIAASTVSQIFSSLIFSMTILSLRRYNPGNNLI